MKTQEGAKSAAPSFDIRKFIKVCFRSWKLFAVCIILCTGIAGVLAYLKTPAYEVDAQLMLKDDAGGGGMMMYGEIARSFALGDMLGMGSSTDNEVAVMQSHAVFLSTVKELGLNISCEKKVKMVKWVPLFTKNPFTVELPPEMADTLSVPLRLTLERGEGDKYDITFRAAKKDLFTESGKTLPCVLDTPYGPIAIGKSAEYDKETGKKFRIGIGSYDGAAESWAKLITIFAPNRKTDFIALSVVVDDPDFGKTLLNTLIDCYNKLGNDEKNTRNSSSLRLVNERLESLTAEMSATESQLEAFKRDNGITDVEYDAQYILSKKSGLEEGLLKAQTATEILRMTLEFVKDDTNATELVPDLIASSGLVTSGAEAARGQIAAYNELILERMRVTGSAREGNNALRQLDEQLAALRGNIIVSVQRAYDNSLVDLRKLQVENERAGGRISSMPALERQYIEIRRVSELQNQIYLFLLQQKEELTLQMASRTISAVTIDEPHVLVEPVGLTKSKILIVGFLLGGLLALMLVYFRKMQKAPLDAADIAAMSQAPVLATLRREGDSLWAVSRDSANAEPLRKLRSDLLLILGESAGKTVLVTSMRQGDGKTQTACNLAASTALIGKRTLLVDGALHSPAVAALMEVEDPANALAEYAAGSETLAVNSADLGGGCSLDVLTARRGPAHPADVLANSRVTALFGELRERYDVIVIDASDLGGHSDAYEWAPVADVTLVVVGAGKADQADIKKINSLYADGRLPRIAVEIMEK